MELPEQKPVAETQKEPPKAQHISWARRYLYLLNHAISCFLTDIFIQTPVSSLVQKYLPKAGKFFENHAHHRHPGHEHEYSAHAPLSANLLTNAKHWVIGEAAGDFTAVPITATLQHYAPWLMSPIRKAVEPFVGRYFRKGAVKDARKWAIERNIAPNSAEAEAKAREFYEYEVSHMGPVVIWNILSASINIFVQKAMLKVPDKWYTLATAKVFSTVFSNSALLGARAASPKTFEEAEYKLERGFQKLAGEKPGEEKNKNPDALPKKKRQTLQLDRTLRSGNAA